MWRSLLFFCFTVVVAVSAHSHQDCGRAPTIRSNRWACNMFVWDAPSALLYKWCNHLLKDNLYEGRGGRMFVRFETSSILQLLYPCTKYSPNRCLLCGGTYPDHLELWWSKHLYTPFDRQVDRTYNEALEVVEEPQHGNYLMSKGGQIGSKKKSYAVIRAPSFSFHKRYVLDVTDLFEGIGKKSQQEREHIRKKTLQLAKEKWGDEVSSLTGMISIVDKKVYVIPGAKEPADKKRLSLSLRATRFFVRKAVERLLYLQDQENAEMQRR